jgi:hypothetical protein
MRLLSFTTLALMAAHALASVAGAQTDYYNTDAGRPVRIEDAYAIERRGFELQAAPLRLERGKGGRYLWGIEPEIAYGVLPRTQLEVGFPLAWVDDGVRDSNSRGLAGIDVSLLHNLNVETSIPAFAIGVSALLPVGSLAPSQAFPSVKGIATRTLSWARFHVNAQYTFGNQATADAIAGAPPAVAAGVVEVSRWLGGIAVDRTFPLRSLLITGEVFALGSIEDNGETDWNATLGSRYQLSPRWAIDGGIGRRLTGDDRAWSFTAGGAVAFGLPWIR